MHPYTLLIIIKKFIGILIIPIISQITWIILSKYRFIKNPVYYNIFIVFCLGVLITLKYVREKISEIFTKNEVIQENYIENIKFKDIRKIKVRSNFIQKYAEIYFLNEHEPKFRIYTDDIYQLELVEEVFLSSIHQNQI